MTTDSADDLPTLAAIGVAGAMLATLAHEFIGHGIGCLAAGGRVTTVSTIIFQCQGGDALTDLGGPLGSLALGLVALCVIASRRVMYREGRLFALIVAGLALFWFFAQLLLAAFSTHDDWA